VSQIVRQREHTSFARISTRGPPQAGQAAGLWGAALFAGGSHEPARSFRSEAMPSNMGSVLSGWNFESRGQQRSEPSGLPVRVFQVRVPGKLGFAFKTNSWSAPRNSASKYSRKPA